MQNHSHACAICGSASRTRIYDGPIRRGRFGQFASGSIDRCHGCGVDQLFAAELLDEHDYRSTTYREVVGEPSDAASFFALHDREQFSRIPLLEGLLQRDQVVADVGCGAGAFLDFIGGVAARTVAIEPALSYHASLRERRHEVFADTSAAREAVGRSADLAVSFSVIEHVADPLHFLTDIHSIMKPHARLLISTPNRDDILMHSGIAEYRSFFYRLVHRYYFDANSLAGVLDRAAFDVRQVHYRHRFGFGNFVAWLRDRQPTSHEETSIMTDAFDARWQIELELAGKADYLYVVAEAR